MIPLTDIYQLVDETIHRALLEFDPGASGSYQLWGKVLSDLEDKIENFTLEPVTKNSLLVRIRSQLALMASMADNHADVERSTASILAAASPEEPSLFLAVLLRIKSLHQLGKHAQEIDEALKYVQLDKFPGQSLLHLLSELARDHPGEIAWSRDLFSRIEEYVREVPGLADEIAASGLSESDPEEYIVGVKKIDQRLNWTRLACMSRKVQE